MSKHINDSPHPNVNKNVLLCLKRPFGDRGYAKSWKSSVRGNVQTVDLILTVPQRRKLGSSRPRTTQTSSRSD